MLEYGEVYTAIKSALSGNGNWKVNYMIRNLKNDLREEFYYTHQDFYDLTNDYTIAMLGNHVLKKFNPEIARFQNFINMVVVNYLKNTLNVERWRLAEKRAGRHATEVPLDKVVAQHDLSLTNFIEDIVPSTDIASNPENCQVAHELVELLHDVFGEESVYLLVFQKRLTQVEAAAKTWNKKKGCYGVSREHFNREYNKKILAMNERLKKDGYI